MIRNLFIAALVLVTTGTAKAHEPEPAPAHAADEVPQASASNVSLLDVWLEHSNDKGRRNRYMSGGVGTAGSGLLIAFGAVAMLDNTPKSEFSKGGGLIALAFGGATLVYSLTSFAIKSSAEKRYARWEKAKADGISATEQARFEGELRAALKEQADGKTRQRRWGSLGMVVSGGLVLGLTAASNLSSTAKRVGYGLGGTMAGFGAIGFGLSFTKSTDLWERYESGLPPGGQRKTQTSLQAAPMFTRNSGGISLSGRF